MSMLALAMGFGVSLAHHAPTMYDTSTEQLVTGTVADFAWTEPHTRVDIVVTGADGADAIWSLEGMTPSYLGRRGWTRHTLRPGDRIEVAFFPRRDGTNGGMFIRARLPDGSLKVMADIAR